ncbi:acetyltransferase [Anaeroarcus burkinensis]|uniref:acetyltransferase n=1 Tax=Anaeroarcus burkinensis TaxID=82376 RepID=UPI0003FCC7BE|nr:acetyltransferase [Anaeroarcus burkinensis]
MTHSSIIVLGAGGHAKVVIEALRYQGATIIGIVDNEPSKRKTEILNIPVIGNDDTILQYNPDEIFLVNGVGSIGQSEVRKRIFINFKQYGYHFLNVIHPAAVVAENVEIREGVQVMAGAVIQTGTYIGENCIINTHASVDHDCRIGAHCHIAPGTTLCGATVVGEASHIGAGATVIQNIHIGSNSVVGAGAVVLKDFPSSSIVYGVPAKEMQR